MIVDVIDIRKRIQKVRNDVSNAVLSRQLPEVEFEPVNADVTLEFVPSPDSADTEKSKLPLGLPEVSDAIPQQTKQAHRAITDIASMPSFNLNVTNRHSSRLLIGLIAMQLLTNLILVAVLIVK
ncbi:MAG: hypothetical protein ACPIC4_08970 [Candidatus Puniceispirillaceae bacterium]